MRGNIDQKINFFKKINKAEDIDSDINECIFYGNSYSYWKETEIERKSGWAIDDDRKFIEWKSFLPRTNHFAEKFISND